MSHLSARVIAARKRRKAAAFVVLAIGVIVCAALATLVLAVSKEHITDMTTLFGVKNQLLRDWSWALVDVVALWGRLLMLPLFIAKTRRFGLKVYIGGGSASLVLNVLHGALVEKSFGSAVTGFVLIGLIALFETGLTRIQVKPVNVPPKAKPAAVVALTPAQKGALTRAANKAAQAPTRTPKAPAPASSPISPGMVTSADVEQLEAVVR